MSRLFCWLGLHDWVIDYKLEHGGRINATRRWCRRCAEAERWDE